MWGRECAMRESTFPPAVTTFPPAVATFPPAVTTFPPAVELSLIGHSLPHIKKGHRIFA